MAVPVLDMAAIAINLEAKVTIPYERTRALVLTKQFLEAITDPKATPRTPRWMRGKAKSLLKHYPRFSEIELAHKALPDTFGPVPPFSRFIASEPTLRVIDATEGEP